MSDTISEYMRLQGRKGGKANTTPQNEARRAAMAEINLQKKKRKLARKARRRNQ